MNQFDHRASRAKACTGSWHLTNMCESGSELADNCWKKQFTELCGLLSSGHPVNQIDGSGLTPLQICASLGWSKAVLLLLKYGADVHATSPLGWTALMQAVANGHTDTSRILLSAGARISDQNFYGMTPLMLAASGGHVDIVDILLSFGANPHILNSSNLTAFDCAMISGYNDLSSILSFHTTPKLKISPTFSIDLCPTLKKIDMISDVNCDVNKLNLHPCTPMCQSPSLYMCPAGCLPCSPCPPASSGYYTQNFHPYISPSFSPNPMVPPWMFTHSQKHNKTGPKLKVKGSKNMFSWWKRLKARYKKKKLKKQIKVYVTFDEKTSDSQLEALLRSLNLDFLLPLMNSHEMDVETFMHLTELDLEELGIADKGLKNLILQNITSLKSNIAYNALQHQRI
ncbi:hypothetical protein FOCC_FOCC007065 [Frankliniella occidentalis]|nr:hypothetical protein FOCC_FOCC007065 [Frankliniella occidentalis]